VTRTSTPVALALCLPVLLAASSARAGGFYLTDRGARPLGRGFAYTAGGTDPHALWYNPANLAWSGQQFLMDGTLTLFDAEFTRMDSGGNTLPSVQLDAPVLPIPTVAYSDDFGLDDWTFGIGVMAPNAALHRWPNSIQVEGMEEPAPQRYSLYTMEGTVLAHVVAGAAWQPIPELSIGIAPQLVVGSFGAEVAVNACDGTICAQPENPEYDGRAQVQISPIIRPAASLGITYATGIVRIGASAMLPFNIGGSGDFRVRLPDAAIFDDAEVEGSRVETNIPFPWVVRMGVELQPLRELRVEANFVVEGWSRQDRIRLSPQDVWLRNVTGIGDYQVGPVDIARGMRNTYSVRVGGDYAFADGRFMVSAGFMWETGAFSDAYLTPLTLDSDKFMLGFGASVQVTEGVWLDASYGHLFMRDRSVTDSQVEQPNPIRPSRMGPSPTEGGPVHVGNGDYAMQAHILGVGLRWQIDARQTPDVNGGAPDPA
jgi:long-chain fatty acid transport protein